ncbi:MAG: GTPase [Planctomycetaceae bacterium]
MTNTNNTSPIASLLTPQGRGAVASIQLRGDAAQTISILSQHFRPKHIAGDTLGEIGRIRYGTWGRHPAEDVVLCRTSEINWEIHCHGGFAASERILADLSASGVKIVPWHDLIAAESGVLETEFRLALSQASTMKTAEYILRQSNGLFAREISSIRDQLLQKAETAVCLQRLRMILKWSTFGRRLTQPAEVVIAGRPNVGKSSLINALLGFTRSIVFDQPGTTRDVVTAETAFDGWPIRLSDTAGMHETADQLEQSGIDRARQKLSDADCQVILLDRSQPSQETDRKLLADFPDALIVVHKIDLPPMWDANPFTPRIDVSSKTGEGIDQLIAAIVETLFPELPPDDATIPLTERQCRLLEQTSEALEHGDRTIVAVSLSALME